MLGLLILATVILAVLIVAMSLHVTVRIEDRPTPAPSTMTEAKR